MLVGVQWQETVLLVLNDGGEDGGEGLDDAEVGFGLGEEVGVVGEAEGGGGVGDAEGDGAVGGSSGGVRVRGDEGGRGAPEWSGDVGAEGEVGDWRGGDCEGAELGAGEVEGCRCELHGALGLGFGRVESRVGRGLRGVGGDELWTLFVHVCKSCEDCFSRRVVSDWLQHWCALRIDVLATSFLRDKNLSLVQTTSLDTYAMCNSQSLTSPHNEHCLAQHRLDKS